ncbi:MAG: hypothetical protein J5855_04450, partial [Mailhella sp.]|nr:hypothetical protein [Mailhella sp.]
QNVQPAPAPRQPQHAQPAPAPRQPRPQYEGTRPNDPRVLEEWNMRINVLNRMRSIQPHSAMEAQRFNEKIQRLEQDLKIMQGQYPWLKR